jgi:hypothetical protein
MIAALLVGLGLATLAPARAQGAGGDVDLDAPDAARAPSPPTAPPVAPPKPLPPSSPATPPATPSATPPATPPAATPKVAPAASASSASSASSSAPTPPEPIAAPPPSTGGAERPSFAVHAWQRGALEAAAVEHLVGSRRGAPAQAKRSLLALQQALAEAAVHGIPGGAAAPTVAVALAREAARFAAEGRTDEALEIAEVALHAAPDDADVAERVAHVRWQIAGLSALGELPGVMARLWQQPARRADIVLRVVVVVVAAVVVLLAVLGVLVGLPRLRLLGFDLWLTLLPRRSHPLQGTALAVLLAAVPWMLGAGVVTTSLWWVTLAMPYLARRTRVVVGVVGVLAAGLPLLIDLGARVAVVPGSDVDLLEAALYDVEGAGDRARARLRSVETVRELSLLESAALAAADRREGRSDTAIERWRTLSQRHADQGWVHGAYAVALATAGRDDGALGELRICVERAGEDAVIGAVCAFDAAMIHARQGHGPEADAAVAGLQAQAQVLADMRRATFRDPDEQVQHNRAFVEVLPPRRLLMQAFPAGGSGSDAEADVEAEALASAVTSPLWHGATGGAAAALLLLFPVLWAVLAAMEPRLRVCRACVRCGAPASRRIDASEVPEGTCSSCFHVFLAKKSRVDPSVKLQKEREILRRGRRRGAMVMALGVLPGGGHLFAGAAVRGALLVLSAALLAGLAVVVAGGWPDPLPSGPASGLVLAVVPVVLCAALLVGSLLGAAALAAEERSGGAR